MTNQRDSSGGYLTGNESERLWDADEDDVFLSDQVDEEDGDGDPSDEEPIESVWARALEVAGEIRSIDMAIDRHRRQTIFDPDDAPIEELEDRSLTLAGERWELESQMQERGFPPAGWLPPPAEPPRPVAALASPPSAGRSRSPSQILRPRLSADEYRHFEWIDQGLHQDEIARRLGISQAAVSKREKKLRARIDAVYIEATRHRYHWTAIPKPQGAVGARADGRL
jgi:DNA-binding CsgD family transcriptional regulator